MKKLILPAIVMALVLAACGSAATLTGSSQRSSTTSGVVVLTGGANAGLTMSATRTRTGNAETHPGMSQTTTGNTTTASNQSNAPSGVGRPSSASPADRCSNGSTVSGNLAVGPVRHPALLCDPE